MTITKPVTVRLAPDVIDQLLGLSIIDDNSLAEQLRAAATLYIAARRSEVGFAEKVREAEESRDRTLAKLVS